MPVFIKVSQNKIKDSKSFGKWYGRVATTKTMTYQELCKHMSEHNSVYGEDVCLGVNIQGLFLCFAPSRTDVNNLSSKMLKKKASFLNVKDMVETKTKPTSSDPTNTGDSGSESPTPSDTGNDTGGDTGGDNSGGSAA